ncbi:MAG: type II toxin-antitoxin system RelE/ParE family toxin [Nitrospinae bacterium]|nr:type II toxin-antitoxin system RelE/ParE family toxin [Nitrospinota bacterium]
MGVAEIALRDLKGKVAVLTRLNRIRVGNPGDWKSVGKGVCEFRIQQGPGYRIYFGKEKEDENRIVILLGGDKNSQKRDIAKAQDYWADYRGEK